MCSRRVSETGMTWYNVTLRGKRNGVKTSYFVQYLCLSSKEARLKGIHFASEEGLELEALSVLPGSAGGLQDAVRSGLMGPPQGDPAFYEDKEEEEEKPDPEDEKIKAAFGSVVIDVQPCTYKPEVSVNDPNS